MTEATVCTRLVNTFLDAGHEAFKIPDMPKTAGTKYNRVKGYDISASIRKDAILIEAKVYKARQLPKRVDTLKKLFTDGQINRFDRVTANGNAHCFGFIIVYARDVIKKVHVHELFVIPWADIMHGAYDPTKYKAVKCKKERYQLQAFFESFPRF